MSQRASTTCGRPETERGSEEPAEVGSGGPKGTRTSTCGGETARKNSNDGNGMSQDQKGELGGSQATLSRRSWGRVTRFCISKAAAFRADQKIASGAVAAQLHGIFR